MDENAKMRNRRLIVLVVTIVVIAFLVIHDSISSNSNNSKSSGQLQSYLVSRYEPEVPSPQSNSSQWYCVAPRQLQGTIPGVVDLASTVDKSISGSAKWVDQTGSVVAITSIVVPAKTQISLASPLASGSYEAVTVTLHGGGVAAWETSGGPGGQSISPCSDFTSKSWLFAGGDTLGSDRLAYMLYNPGTTQALVQLNFFDSTGSLDSSGFQAIVVPPFRLTTIDVTNAMLDLSSVGTAIQCRLGQVVAYQLEIHPPTPATASSAIPLAGTGSIVSTLGVPSLRKTWYFPQGVTSSSDPEYLYVFNPSSTLAKVMVSFYFSSGAASPQPIDVQPDSVYDLALNSDSRVPHSISEFLTFTVALGPPVVVYQSVGSQSPGTSSTSGVSKGSGSSPWQAIVPGLQTERSSWIFGGTPEGLYDRLQGNTQVNTTDVNQVAFGETVVVANPTKRATKVSLYFLGRGALVPVEGTSQVVVAPGTHVYLQLPPLPQDLEGVNQLATLVTGGPNEIEVTDPALEVRATGPVVATCEITLNPLAGWTTQQGVELG